MRIVVDYTPAVFQTAGIGRHTRGLMRALAPVVAQEGEHTLTLLVFGKPRAGVTGLPPGCRLKLVPVPNRWLTLVWHRARVPLPVEALCGSTDLFHAPDFVLPPLWRARGLLTVHDLSFMTVPEFADTSLRGFLSNAVPRSIQRADALLADSQNTKNDLTALLGVSPDRVTVVYPGVEPRFQPLDDASSLLHVRARYGLGDGPFILGVGTLEPRKNWPGLIQAWSMLKREAGLPHRLVIAGGNGWLYESIFQTAQCSGFADEITFTGFVDDQDLPALYGAADVLALPSFYEGFGIPVLEAMACGTPVVCADNSSLPEVAGDAALLVDARDYEKLAAALLTASQDSQLRATLRSRGMTQAARFTWDASARALLQAYQKVYHGRDGIASPR